MISVEATIMAGGSLLWRLRDDSHFQPEEGVTLTFCTSSLGTAQRREAINQVTRALAEDGVTWIKPGHKVWTIDLDAFSKSFPTLQVLKWFTGFLAIEPEFEPQGKADGSYSDFQHANLVFYITREAISASDFAMTTPVEIQNSLQKFRQDYPPPTKVAFIMMQFGRTKAHEAIVQAISAALEPHGIVAVRADHKTYHDELFSNIRTYLHGCTFGVAVFERLESEQFNPNVSLEVGYLLALQKPVCLLKDDTLRTLTSDLAGKLYTTFNTQSPMDSVRDQLIKWCADKELIRKDGAR